jgi:hypothetical protein
MLHFSVPISTPVLSSNVFDQYVEANQVEHGIVWPFGDQLCNISSVWTSGVVGMFLFFLCTCEKSWLFIFFLISVRDFGIRWRVLKKKTDTFSFSSRRELRKTDFNTRVLIGAWKDLPEVVRKSFFYSGFRNFLTFLFEFSSSDNCVETNRSFFSLVA